MLAYTFLPFLFNGNSSWIGAVAITTATATATAARRHSKPYVMSYYMFVAVHIRKRDKFCRDFVHKRCLLSGRGANGRNSHISPSSSLCPPSLSPQPIARPCSPSVWSDSHFSYYFIRRNRTHELEMNLKQDSQKRKMNPFGQQTNCVSVCQAKKEKWRRWRRLHHGWQNTMDHLDSILALAYQRIIAFQKVKFITISSNKILPNFKLF